MVGEYVKKLFLVLLSAVVILFGMSVFAEELPIENGFRY